MTVALSMRGITKAHGKGRHQVRALRGANLDLGGGEVVPLECPSGSGKTTLMLVAAGLLTPDEGEVSIGGQILGEMSRAALRAFRARRIGFVFQRANLLDGLDVRDNVRLAAALSGMPTAETDAAADHLLGELGIAALSGRLTDALSGGEEHRVAVARALVHRPAVVLADEPTGNLDSASGQAVTAALVGLARRSGVAVLIATHDARLRSFATRRIALSDGVLSEIR